MIDEVMHTKNMMKDEELMASSSNRITLDEVTNDVTCLHSGRPLLFYAGKTIYSVYDRTHTIILKPYLQILSCFNAVILCTLWDLQTCLITCIVCFEPTVKAKKSTSSM